MRRHGNTHKCCGPDHVTFMLRNKWHSFVCFRLKACGRAELMVTQVWLLSSFLKDFLECLGHLLAQWNRVNRLLSSGEPAGREAPRQVILAAGLTWTGFIKASESFMRNRQRCILGPAGPVCATLEGCVLEKVADSQPGGRLPK